MATLTQIRDELKTVLKNNIDGLHVYSTVEDAVNFPAAVVMPSPNLDIKTVKYGMSMARGHDEWHVNIYILIPRGADVAAAQDQLDQYLSGSGPKSIREVLWTNAALLPDGTDVSVESASGYGGNFETGNTPCVGAIIQTTILSPGTA